MEERREAAKLQSNVPWSFWMPPEEEVEIVVLDEAIDTFYRHEHALPDPNNQNRPTKFVPCLEAPDDGEFCPVCENAPDSHPSYVMIFTILTFYEDKDGNEAFSRKLMRVKLGMQPKWTRMQDSSAVRDGNNGSMRGAIVKIFRDDQRSPNTGSDIDLVGFMSEDELSEYVREYTNREGKTIQEDASQPVDYDEVFPPMTYDQLLKVVGGRPRPGSRATEDAELDDEGVTDEAWNSADEEAEEEWEEGDEEAEEEGEEEVEEEAEEEVEEAPPRRRAGVRPAVRPAARPAARKGRR